MSRSASSNLGVERSTIVSVGRLLFGLLLTCISSGCRSLDPTGSQGSGRIPPPATGSYSIPNGAARAGSEPYYSRPEGSAAGSTAITPAAGSPTTQRSGSWYQASPTTSNSSGTAPAPTLPLPAPPAASVAPASFSPWQGGTAAPVSRASFTESAEGSANVSPTESAPSLASDEPGRITPGGSPLPTEIGPIGSGVRTVPSSEVPADAGRRAGGSTTAPRPLTVDDLLNAGGSTTWRPRF